MLGGVLALDLAGTVGWALGRLDDKLPTCGIWLLPKIGGEGARYAAFENELATMIEATEPSHLILEGPLPLGAQTNLLVAAQQLTLRGIAMSEAWRASIPCSSIDPYTARAEVMGRGTARKGEIKAEVVAFCRSIGIKVTDHNAADACVVWLWHTGRLRGHAYAGGPLLRRPPANEP